MVEDHGVAGVVELARVGHDAARPGRRIGVPVPAAKSAPLCGPRGWPLSTLRTPKPLTATPSTGRAKAPAQSCSAPAPRRRARSAARSLRGCAAGRCAGGVTNRAATVMRRVRHCLGRSSARRRSTSSAPPGRRATTRKLRGARHLLDVDADAARASGRRRCARERHRLLAPLGRSRPSPRPAPPPSAPRLRRGHRPRVVGDHADVVGAPASGSVAAKQRRGASVAATDGHRRDYRGGVVLQAGHSAGSPTRSADQLAAPRRFPCGNRVARRQPATARSLIDLIGRRNWPCVTSMDGWSEPSGPRPCVGAFYLGGRVTASPAVRPGRGAGHSRPRRRHAGRHRVRLRARTAGGDARRPRRRRPPRRRAWTPR